MPQADSISPSAISPGSRTHRSAALDVFRAIVCLQIVAMHTYFGAAHERLDSWLGTGADWAVTHLRFGFESFFVIAGYFLARSFRRGQWQQFSVSRFFTRRIVRLAVPYWIAVVLGIVGLLGREYATGFPSGVPGFPEILPVFFFAHTLGSWWSPSTALWFMAVLIQFYVAWCLAFWVIRRYYLWAGNENFHDRAVAALQFFTAAVFLVSLAGYFADESQFGEAVRCAVFLALGCMTYWQSDTVGMRVFLRAGLAVLVAAGLWDENSRLIAAAVTSLILPLLAHRTAPDNRLVHGLAAIGTCSYSIYLTHMYVAPRVLYLPSKWGGITSIGEAAVVYFVAIAAAVAFGFVFHWIVERPLARISSRINYRVARQEKQDPHQCTAAHS